MPPKSQDSGRFSAARIKRIMQADPDVGQIAKDTPPVVSAVLEQYLKDLVSAAALATIGVRAPATSPNALFSWPTPFARCAAGGGKMIKPSHLKAAVAADPRFDSLKDLTKDIPDAGAAAAVPAAAAAGGAGAAATGAVPTDPAGSAAQKRVAEHKSKPARPTKRKKLLAGPPPCAVVLDGNAAGATSVAGLATTDAACARANNVSETALTKARRVTEQAARAAASDEDYDDDSE